MSYRSIITVFFLVLSALSVSAPAWAKLTIYSQADAGIDLIVYNGLNDSSLFKGKIVAKTPQEIDTPYLGLALLVFSGGQSYPVIIGDVPLTLQLTGPNISPTFPVGSENEFLYKLLSGEDAGTVQYAFAHLMIQAKRLLESSHNIHTTKELSAKKIEFHEFVGEHYDSLKHSDMVRRLIAQYFMMHEYIDYHRDGAPATDIRLQYQKVVLNGVGNWMKILHPHIPGNEILNYCVSLYYERSMVTLASLIIEKYRNAAYCLGVEKQTFSFPKDLLVTGVERGRERKLDNFKSKKIIAFVSDSCPVSKVETVVMARRLSVQKNDIKLIIAPLQQLSDKHLTISRMVSGGNLLFVDDEKWREENLATKIKLPLFIEVGRDPE